jgi:hypothetical protein
MEVIYTKRKFKIGRMTFFLKKKLFIKKNKFKKKIKMARLYENWRLKDYDLESMVLIEEDNVTRVYLCTKSHRKEVYERYNDSAFATHMNGHQYWKLINGGSGAIEDVTYTEFSSKLRTSTLVPGQKYKITDYQTIHPKSYKVGAFNGMMDHVYYDFAATGFDTLHTGTTEPLIVTAVATNTIDKKVQSTLHPNDIIHYEPLKNIFRIKDTYYQEGMTLTVPTGSTREYTLPATGKTYVDTYFSTGYTMELMLKDDNDNYVLGAKIPKNYQSNIFIKNIVRNEGLIKTNDGIKYENGKIKITDPTTLNELSGVNITGATLNVYSIANTKGWISYREDTDLDIKMHVDFRNWVTRRWYVASTFPLGAGYYHFHPTDQWDRLGGTDYYADDPNKYYDFPMFSVSDGGTGYTEGSKSGNFRAISIGRSFGMGQFYSNVNNIFMGSYVLNLDIVGDCSDVTFENSYHIQSTPASMDIGYIKDSYALHMSSSNYDHSFVGNVLTDCSHNELGLKMITTSIVGGGFRSNDLRSAVWRWGISGDSCNGNVFGYSNDLKIYDDNFENNVFESPHESYGGMVFSGSTMATLASGGSKVQKTIFYDESGNKKIRYLKGDGTWVISGATD